jgi:glycosyltransferase involved in cell wall biosynthesis
VPKNASTPGGEFAGVPQLSVVMPVHNALPHLDQAIESILGQTFRDFEFVILDDGSTDGTRDRLRHWAKLDRRIRLLESDENLGPVGSSNRVARAARSPFVARMDGDDVSYPDRLAEQLQLLRDNPGVGIVASVCDLIDTHGRKLRDPEVWRLARRSVFVPFAHGAMMYRRDVFDRVGGYRSECEYWEDQDLVVRMAALAKVVVIPRALYRVRQSQTSTRVGCNSERLERALDRFYRATDLLIAGQDYTSLLQSTTAEPRKLDPRVVIAHGSIHLWAGARPQLLWRLLSRAELSWNAQTAAAALWAAWASASPSSLRAFLLFLLRARNRLASARVMADSPVVWDPFLVSDGRNVAEQVHDAPKAAAPTVT